MGKSREKSCKFARGKRGLNNVCVKPRKEKRKEMSEQQPYVVSARKYRPATFRSVVGQRALTATLKNAISGGRLAQAYLFCGPRGVGKTSCARIFAKTINCLNPTAEGEACGECASCRAIEQGNSFNLVELDAASNNSVNDIRTITEQVNVAPPPGQYRVFIIDEVHMLSNAAFNAFLKTLEEPPKYVIFILATTEKHKVIPTILSRCQIYDFKRITIDDMVDHLEYVAAQEGVNAERDALGVIALKADGAMRDALSIFDQVSASSRGQVTYANTIESLNVLDYDYYFRIVDGCRSGDVAEVLLIYKEIRDKGFDSLFFVNGLAAHIRDLMVAADARTAPLLETSGEIAARYTQQAQTLPVQWYYAAMKILNETDFNYRTASSKRLLVEVSLIRLCQLLKPATPPFDKLDYLPPLGDPRASIEAAHGGKPAQEPVRQEPPRREEQSAVRQPSDEPQPRQESGPSHSEEGGVAYNTAARPRARGQRPSSFRLSESATHVSASASSLEQRTEPFTPEDFMRGWGEFIARNPSLQILVNTMRSSHPAAGGPEEYRIIVDHPAQLQAFELSMPKLLEFLRGYLRNDRLTLHVEVNDTPVANKQLPPKEFLREVVTHNRAMADFLKELNAELC